MAVAVAAAAIFYYTDSKSNKTLNPTINPAFGEYISSYTAGMINSGSRIRIVLSQDAVDFANVGDEITIKLFELSPSIKGKTVWLDKRTIEFRPDTRFISGQTYEVRFNLGRLIEVPKALTMFSYSVQVIPQSYDVQIENVKSYSKSDLKRQKIEGILLTADFAEDAAVEGMISAQQDGNSLKVNWTHTGEGKQHAFVVEEVLRKDAASSVKLAISGKSLGVEQTEDREVEIPALGDFKVTNIRVDQSTAQHVVVQFSDPLNERQNLEGLIRIGELSSLDFEIKENEIRIYPPVRQTGVKTLTIEAGVLNILNYKMSQASSSEIAFEQLLPAVRFTTKGSVLPSSEGLVLPFEAVNLKAVDVKIIQIYENNILQFLQVNSLNGNEELRRVGKYT